MSIREDVVEIIDNNYKKEWLQIASDGNYTMLFEPDQAIDDLVKYIENLLK